MGGRSRCGRTRLERPTRVRSRQCEDDGILRIESRNLEAGIALLNQTLIIFRRFFNNDLIVRAGVLRHCCISKRPSITKTNTRRVTSFSCPRPSYFPSVLPSLFLSQGSVLKFINDIFKRCSTCFGGSGLHSFTLLFSHRFTLQSFNARDESFSRRWASMARSPDRVVTD